MTQSASAMVMGRSQSMPKLGCLTSLKQLHFFLGDWGHLLILYKSADYPQEGGSWRFLPSRDKISNGFQLSLASEGKLNTLDCG